MTNPLSSAKSLDGPNVHYISNEVFDFAKMPNINDNSIYSTEWVRVQPNTPPDLNTPGAKQKSRFVMECQDLNSWYLLSESMVHISFKLEIGPLMDPESTSTYPNTDIRQMIDYAELTLGNQPIETHSNELYWCWALMDRLTWTKKYSETVGSMWWADRWVKQGGDGQNAIGDSLVGAGLFGGPITQLKVQNDPTVFGGNTFTNKGNIGESTRGYHNAVFNQKGPDRLRDVVHAWIPFTSLFAFCQSWDKVIKGLAIKTTFLKSDNDNRWITRENPSGGGLSPNSNQDTRHIWHGNGMELWLKRIVPTVFIEKMLTQRLVDGTNLRINFEDFECHQSKSFELTEASGEWRMINTGAMPTRIALFAMRPENLRNQLEDTSMFNLNEWYSFTLFINGKRIPQNDVYYHNQLLGGTNAADKSVQNDPTTLYTMYQDCCQAYKAPYLRKFKGGGSNLDMDTFRKNYTSVWWDLHTEAFGEYVSGRSEVVVQWKRNINMYPNETKKLALFGVIWTQREVELSMKDHKSYITVRSGGQKTGP